MVTLVLLSTLGLAALARANPLARADCSDLQLVFLAGTGESGLGLVGEPLAASLAEAVPGATTYAIPYNTSVEYDATLTEAVAIAQAYFESQSAACPNQKFAYGGYSKGAMVVHRTTLSSEILNKIVALVVFGDPYKKYQSDQYEDLWPINNPVVNSTPNSTVASANIASFCNSGDIICDLMGGEVEPHLAYGSDGSASVAAKFIAGIYGS